MYNKNVIHLVVYDNDVIHYLVYDRLLCHTLPSGGIRYEFRSGLGAAAAMFLAVLQ